MTVKEIAMNDIRVMISKDEIEKKVAELGKCLSDEYSGKDVVVVGVLKGAFIFMADLVRAMTIPLHLDFLHCKSYVGSSSTGIVNIKMDYELDIKGKHVIIVEDILDTGRTLKALKERFKNDGAESVKIPVFLDKPGGRVVEIDADYSCFTIENKFVVGYGLDYDENYRNLDYVGEVIL